MFQLPPLTIPYVFKTLRALTEMSGKKVGQAKNDTIKKMIVACKGTEAKYLVRSLQGNLRIGLAGKICLSCHVLLCTCIVVFGYMTMHVMFVRCHF